MVIQLISYINNLSRSKRLNNTIEVINNSEADFILFTGHTLERAKDIFTLQSKIKNENVQALFEVQDINSEKVNNCLYHLKNGHINNLYTNQLFFTSKEINDNDAMADRFLHELETKRLIKIRNKKALVFQCGELNILKNLQSKDNKVEFRLNSNTELKRRFKAG